MNVKQFMEYLDVKVKHTRSAVLEQQKIILDIEDRQFVGLSQEDCNKAYLKLGDLEGKLAMAKLLRKKFREEMA